jgi:DNA-directed RNA polymerase subunit RPC12/RpoP
MQQFKCPKCKAVLQATSEEAGATIVCPKCKTQMLAPATIVCPKCRTQMLVPASPSALPPLAPPVPVPKWYYAKGGKKVGPVTEGQLKELVRSGERSLNLST